MMIGFGCLGCRKFIRRVYVDFVKGVSFGGRIIFSRGEEGWLIWLRIG